MSADNNEADTSCCASCGIVKNNDVKLKNCTGCYLVSYCSIQCQKDHRPKHKRACRKRAAELRDELLSRQPESICLGDCPICLIPMAIDPLKSIMMGCCSKLVCNGCSYANQVREGEMRAEPRCPFCRNPAPKSQKESDKNEMKRVVANDPVALREEGTKCREEGDYKAKFRYLTKAVDFGDSMAHHQLSWMYGLGLGVEKDKKKEVYHAEEAALGGHPEARYNIGVYELNDGRSKRAIKHFMIGATLGHDPSLVALKKLYQDRLANKEDFAAALRAHQAAMDATKSPHRDAAPVVRRS